MRRWLHCCAALNYIQSELAVSEPPITIQDEVRIVLQYVHTHLLRCYHYPSSLVPDKRSHYTLHLTYMFANMVCVCCHAGLHGHPPHSRHCRFCCCWWQLEWRL